jgi:hypothetical protein
MFGPEPFPPHCGLVATAVAFTADTIIVAAKSIASSADCPNCGTQTQRIYRRYIRTAADLRRQGRRVILRLTMGRFRWRTVGCRRVIFCERVPHVLAPLARSISRFVDVQRAVGLVRHRGGQFPLSGRRILTGRLNTEHSGICFTGW